MTQGEPLLILGSIGQRSNSYFTHVLPLIRGATLLISGSKVKVKLGKFDFLPLGYLPVLGQVSFLCRL